MRRSILTVLLLLGAACGGDADTPDDTMRVALVTPGSVADAAWNAGAFAGLEQLRDSLLVDISHVEARTPAEQEEALRSYAAQGYTLVFGHGFEFQQPAERVSAEFPSTIFAITSGQRVAGQVVPIVFRIHEATYLLGRMAGALTRTNTIGFLGGMELPPIVLGLRGWEEGARAENPDVDSRVAWLNTFDDAAAGKEATLAMLRLGVDQVHHNADAAALGAFSAVRETPGILIYGANANQASLAPDRVAASAVLDLPRAMLLIAREVAAGTFTPKVESFGLESDVVRFELNDRMRDTLPGALVQRVMQARDSIIKGLLVVAGTPAP